MIDAKQLAELMRPEKLHSLADSFNDYRTIAYPVLTHADLDAVTAILREVARRETDDPQDPIPGSDADIAKHLELMVDALGYGVAILLRRSFAHLAADCLKKATDAYRIARERHAKLKANDKPTHRVLTKEEGGE